ncbi:hypothetical protein ZIOFF_028452 [Zingiber officinale]|uniref:Citrate transporter-like domain-containing protein n=1 Tax=Zingiber officinale TaxID=94328 RepID=A0A8J5L9W6_ZINOF|nr:hypothetical protein ZIOFF_028452 [Zingiber officinale]
MLYQSRATFSFPFYVAFIILRFVQILCQGDIHLPQVYALAISFFELFLLKSWSTIAAALALIVLDFQDARPSLEKIIMLVKADYMEPYARIDTASGSLVLTVVILFLSNVASNVPTVLLLGARVAASAAEISPGEETKAWLMLAWVSTVAGNLSLLGSAANLIVCKQARRCWVAVYDMRNYKPSTKIVALLSKNNASCREEPELVY